MIDRVDLFIAVMGVVVSVLGSSTALFMAVSKKADKDDLTRAEGRLEAKIDAVEGRLEAKIDAVEGRLETKFDAVEARVGVGLTRVESKLDSLILRLVPEQSPQPEN